jgi:Domain of unknown function (DUF6265)
MKTWVIASASLLLASASPPAKPEIELSQLTGEWIMEENGRWVRETWGVPTANGIEGTGQSGVGSKPDFTEHMRITKDEKEGVRLFVKLGKSRSETSFKLVSDAYGQWMFENLRHDYPQRIIYFRSGGWLFAKTMKADGSKYVGYSYRPAKPPLATVSKPVPNLEQVEDAVTFSRACIDTTGKINCLPPTQTKVRNLICWPMGDLEGYIEPYRSSPAAECSFEAHEVSIYPPLQIRVARKRKLKETGGEMAVNWRASWARLHFLETNECPGKFCKQIWHIPRN